MADSSTRMILALRQARPAAVRPTPNSRWVEHRRRSIAPDPENTIASYASLCMRYVACTSGGRCVDRITPRSAPACGSPPLASQRSCVGPARRSVHPFQHRRIVQRGLDQTEPLCRIPGQIADQAPADIHPAHSYWPEAGSLATSEHVAMQAGTVVAIARHRQFTIDAEAGAGRADSRLPACAGAAGQQIWRR